MICAHDVIIIRLLMKLIPSQDYPKGIGIILVAFQTEIRDEIFYFATKWEDSLQWFITKKGLQDKILTMVYNETLMRYCGC